MKKASKIKIAKTYADALFEAALTANCLKEVARDACALKNIDCLDHLASPFLSNKQKDELIDIVQKKLSLTKTSTDFLRILIEDKVLLHLQSVLDVFNNRFLDYQGIVKVVIETVQPLTKAQEQILIKGLEKKLKKEVILDYKLNESLLGGLILHIGSIEIDDSVLNKLKTLENMMKGC